MYLGLISQETTILSGAAATGTAVTFDSTNSPLKITRFYGTLGNYTAAASGRVNIFANTGELLYQSADIAPSGSFNMLVDCNVYPGYSVRLTVASDIGPGNTGITTIKMQWET